jgi:hypothetical protein
MIDDDINKASSQPTRDSGRSGTPKRARSDRALIGRPRSPSTPLRRRAGWMTRMLLNWREMVHTLWVGFADRPSEQQQVTSADLDGGTERRAFDGARRSGRLNGRRVTWMLLIDAGLPRRRLVASYGDKYPPTLNSCNFRIDPGREHYPSVNPRRGGLTGGYPDRASK